MNDNRNMPSIDEFLGESISPEEDSLAILDEPLNNSPVVTLAPGDIDPRLKLFSHSSRTMLHKCPRRYQLYRLAAQKILTDTVKETESGVTFAYGTVVGLGIQSTLEGKTEDEVLLEAFLEWNVDLLDETPRQKKSFWHAIFAIQKFRTLKDKGYLSDYELVYVDGKPAVELSFRIHLPDGFKYRGYVDVVLRNKKTDEVLILELKTSSGTANAAMYKNSGQALGYSVVLDKLFPDLSAYHVLYLVYETKAYAFKELPFEKSLLQRALWLQELLIDSKHVELYESFETYPMHGESCYDFFRECEYLGICTLDTSRIAKPLTEEIMLQAETETYMFEVDFFELVQSQIEKGEV